MSIPRLFAPPHPRYRSRRDFLRAVGNGFGLGEIELIVQERPARELSRLRAPCTELDAPLDQHAQYDGSAVCLQLENVFTGIRLRPREIERDALVDRIAPGVAKAHEARPSGRHYSTARAQHDRFCAWTGYPHDADAGLPAGSCERNDGVSVGHAQPQSVPCSG